MRSRAPKVALCTAILAALLVTGLAGAASTQRVALGKGALSAPTARWEASAVPRGSILIDLFDRTGDLVQTYGKSTGPMRGRQIEATGFRPDSPTRHALVAGATGAQVRKVRIHVKGGDRITVRTTPSPADWDVANRLFARGFTVPARHRAAMRVITKIEGLNARGRVIATQRTVPTDSY